MYYRESLIIELILNCYQLVIQNNSLQNFQITINAYLIV